MDVPVRMTLVRLVTFFVGFLFGTYLLWLLWTEYSLKLMPGLPQVVGRPCLASFTLVITWVCGVWWLLRHDHTHHQDD